MYREQLEAALQQRYGMEKEAFWAAAGRGVGKLLARYGGKLGARAGAATRVAGGKIQKGVDNTVLGLREGWKQSLNKPDTTALVPAGTKIIPSNAYRVGESARVFADDAMTFAKKHPLATAATATGLAAGDAIMDKAASTEGTEKQALFLPAALGGGLVGAGLGAEQAWKNATPMGEGAYIGAAAGSLAAPGALSGMLLGEMLAKKFGVRESLGKILGAAAGVIGLGALGYRNGKRVVEHRHAKLKEKETKEDTAEKLNKEAAAKGITNLLSKALQKWKAAKGGATATSPLHRALPPGQLKNYRRTDPANPLNELPSAKFPSNQKPVAPSNTLPPLDAPPVTHRALPEGQLRNFTRSGPDNPLNQLAGRKK